MSIVKAIRNSYKKAHKKGWKETYWIFDIHSTIIKPNYERGNIPKEFYADAKRVLQMLSKRKDIVMIIYTCSWPEEQKKYLEFFKEHDIHFKYINENPEITSDEGGFGYYEDKPYCDVMLEDKAGFDPEVDWKIIELEMKNYTLYT